MTKLTLDQANLICQRTIAAARAAGAKPVAVVVLDESGHVKAAQREDGATMFCTDVALGKAWGAVAMGESSRALAKRARENPGFTQGLIAASGGRLMPNPGGVLIRDGDGTIIGAAGVSGDKGVNDEGFAISAIEAAGLAADSDE